MDKCDQLLAALAKVEELRSQGGANIMGSPLHTAIYELTRVYGAYLREI